MNTFTGKCIELLFNYRDNVAVIEPVISNGRIIGEKSYSYGRLFDDAIKLASTLNNLNVGCQAGIFMFNEYAFLPAFLGSILAGKTVVPLDSGNFENAYASARRNNLDFIISSDRAPRISSHQATIHQLLTSSLNKQTTSGNLPGSGLISKDSPIIVSPTSGTSGAQKDVVISEGNVLSTSARYCVSYSLDKNKSFLLALPMYHNYAMFANLAPGLLSGSTFVILRHWNQQIAREAIKKYSTSVFSGSPYMYMDWVNNGITSDEISTLKICDVGGAFMPSAYLRRFEQMTDLRITEGYGLTETSSFTHFNQNPESRIIGSIGTALPGVNCRIMNDRGVELSDGEYGNLQIQGDMVALGYRTREGSLMPLTHEGWFNTGDIAKRDAMGNFFLKGRRNEIITSKGGFASRAIEEKLYQNPGIVECDAILDSDRQTFNIVVKPNGSTDITAKDIQKIIEDTIPSELVNNISLSGKFFYTSTHKHKLLI